MKKCRLIQFSFIFIALLLAAQIAQAHPPYLIKQGYLFSPDGDPLIKEKLYGDGVVTLDPSRFQVRNMNGAVIASSPIDSHLTFLCPHLKFCWAVPYGHNSILPTVWRLDYKNLEYSKSIKTQIHEGQEKKFNEYLKDPYVKRVTSPGTYEDTEALEAFGFKSSIFGRILAPLLIIADQFIPLFIIFSLIGGMYAYIYYKTKRQHLSEKKISIISKFVSILLGISYMIFSWVTLMFTGFFFGTPVPYVLLILIPLTVKGTAILNKQKAELGKKDA